MCGSHFAEVSGKAVAWGRRKARHFCCPSAAAYCSPSHSLSRTLSASLPHTSCQGINQKFLYADAAISGRSESGACDNIASVCVCVSVSPYRRATQEFVLLYSHLGLAGKNSWYCCYCCETLMPLTEANFILEYSCTPTPTTTTNWSTPTSPPAYSCKRQLTIIEASWSLNLFPVVPHSMRRRRRGSRRWSVEWKQVATADGNKNWKIMVANIGRVS